MDVEGKLTERQSPQQQHGRPCTPIALGLALLAVALAVGGFLVSGLLTLLAVIAGVASVTVAVRAIRGGSDRGPKIIAAVAIVLAALIVLAVLWLIVAFALNPPD